MNNVFDPRHLEGIEIKKRYTTSDAATILGCSTELILKLCDRTKKSNGKGIDIRHIEDISKDKKYSDMELSRLLNVSHTTIYNFRKIGELEETPLRRAVRIPGWSAIDFINRNASSPADESHIDFLSIGRVLRIPGWSLADFISKRCSRI